MRENLKKTENGNDDHETSKLKCLKLSAIQIRVGFIRADKCSNCFGSPVRRAQGFLYPKYNNEKLSIGIKIKNERLQ